MPGRYRSYGREDDPMKEDLEIGFSGFNNRVRPDQLKPGVLAESKNGRLDLNGEWQVRKGVNVLNVPFVTGSAVFRLPTAAEKGSTTIGNLPQAMEGVSIATDGIVTVTLTNHGFSVGDEVVINGVFRASLPDINGSYTITVASGANRFKFDSGITGSTGSYTYPPAQGLITSFTLPFDPVTEVLSTQPLSSPGGTSILSEGAVTGVRAGTDYSNPDVAKDGEYIVVSTNLSALVLKLSNQETFEMKFPDGESVLQRSDMLHLHIKDTSI